jgi:hypothetical protein
MSEQVTVKTVGEGRPWEHGITYWDVCFDRNGADFHCTWGKKDDPPQVGEQAEGEFFQKNGEWRFRKASKPQGGGGSFESSSGASPAPLSGSSSGRNLDQSIARQVALKIMAESINSEGGLTLDIRRHVEEIEGFILEAGQAVNSAQGSAHQQESASPPTSVPPGSNSPSANDTPQFFAHLLESAHVDHVAAVELGKFIAEKFSPEQQKKAARELGEIEVQGDCVRRLTGAYEQFTSRLLPRSTDDASIPF